MRPAAHSAMSSQGALFSPDVLLSQVFFAQATFALQAAEFVQVIAPAVTGDAGLAAIHSLTLWGASQFVGHAPDFVQAVAGLDERCEACGQAAAGGQALAAGHALERGHDWVVAHGVVGLAAPANGVLAQADKAAACGQADLGQTGAGPSL
jgi:hypothetical protein